MAKDETIHVALLRGINVGGKNKLPMKALVEIIEGAGGLAVETYIQSGNVVFSASRAVAQKLPAKVSAGIKKELGLEVPVITRSASEFAKVAKNHVLAHPSSDPKSLHVAFLASRPTKAQIASLDPNRSPPDQFKVVGQDVFLLFPNGVAKTKLSTSYFDRQLGTITTVRNWNTVQALLKMTRSR